MNAYRIRHIHSAMTSFILHANSLKTHSRDRWAIAIHIYSHFKIRLTSFCERQCRWSSTYSIARIRTFRKERYADLCRTSVAFCYAHEIYAAFELSEKERHEEFLGNYLSLIDEQTVQRDGRGFRINFCHSLHLTVSTVCERGDAWTRVAASLPNPVPPLPGWWEKEGSRWCWR